MTENIVRLSKIDAAERQLRVALRLYAEGWDLVAIHTLAAAARTVLRDLARQRGLGSIIEDAPFIRPDRKKEVREILSAAQNFFKHADQDPDAIHDFRPDATPFFLFDAVEMLMGLKGSLFKEALVFRGWMYARYPHFFADETLRQQFEQFREALGPQVADFGLALKTVDELERSGHLPRIGT